GQNDRDPRRVFVPVTIGRVSCHDRVPNEALVYLRQKNSDAQRMVFDLYLGSEAGRLFAVIEDLTMQAVLGHEPAVPGSEDPLAEAARFYSFEMEPLPRAPEAAADSEVSPGAIILFTNGADIPRPGFGAPERPGPIVVTAGSEFEQLDALTVRINPENPEDYATLLEAYPAARTLVVCEDFCRSPASAGMFFAARALQSSKRQSTPLALFRLVTSPDDLIGRAFAGFARSLRREDPRIDCAVLELETNETAGGIDPARIAAVLLREISYRRSAGAVQDMEVRLPSRADQPRSARRWREITDALEVPELIEGRADFGNSEFAGNPSQGVAGLRRGGVYLITGGAGGVGRTIAKFLVQRYQARVILCGRSPAPSDPLFDGDEHVGYVQADLTDVSDVQNLVADILRRHSTLHGVIHAAGVLEDALFVNKDFGAFQRVLAPKIRGVQNLDDATRDVALDFFVSFSSIVAGLGNVGQCDYALANSYLDAFAGRREGLREAGERHGRSLSIAWPYWKDGGGMRLAPELEAALETSLGIRAITAAGALRAFETLLKSLGALPERVLVASRGDRLPEFDGLRIRESDTTTAPSAADSRSGEADANLAKRVEHDLIQIFARELRTTERKVAPDQPFARYGVDSLLIVRLNATLEKKFGKLPKTLFFEYSNLRDLARYFVANHAKHYSVAEKPPAPPAAQSPIMAGRNAPYAAQRAAPSFVHGRSDSAGALEIAIIGMSGRYPGADDTEEFWRNLRAGRDCITEVPSERWPADLFDENKDRAGKSYSRWGGFVSDADCFDPLFFNISPLEATRMDPQERLFLQTVWNTLEDAGYTPGNIAQTPPDEADGLQANAGVFVGVMWGDYQLFGVQEALKGAAWRRPGRVIGASRTAYRIV
ncbi:MAG: SDR family NAD(P)-dependent oxidoreductase, partial [Leptospirales bacterium]